MEKLTTTLSKNEKIYSETDLIAYEKYSQGCIELHKDYVVIYHNQLPLRNCVKGRTTTIINLKSIKQFSYKGTGWLRGYMTFWYNYMSKPKKFGLSVLFVRRRKRFNINLMPIFEYISKYVVNSWHEENYRKVEMVQELANKGYCPMCEKEISSENDFCPNCGNKIK